jgi:5-methylcytosine-specific restriction endonuclease McrA
VRAITRVATPANESELVDRALTSTASQVERFVRAYRTSEMAAQDNEASQHDNRYLSVRWLDDGSLQITGQLPAEIGALLLKAIKDATRVPAGTSDTPSQRRVDALERVLTSPASTNTVGTAIVVHSHCDGSHLHDGPSISNAAAERLACDCTLVDATTGASTRVVPPAMRRALNARDDHQCQFAGCTHQGWLDAHHRQHWTNGGPTQLDNLVLLCRHHHRAVHERGWSIGADGTFYDPYGRPAIVQPPTLDLVSVL